MRLLIAVLLLLPPSPAAAQDAGAGPTDGGAPSEPVRPVPARGEVLSRRIQHLEKALMQDPSLEVSLGALFPIDLTDDEAVSARVREIDRQLVDLRGRVSTSSTATVTAQRPSAAQLEVRALTLERDFLQQNRAIRMAIVEAEEARLRLLKEKSDTELRRKEAEEEAKTAEVDRLRALEEAQRARTAAIQSLKSKRAAVLEAHGKLAARNEQLSKLQARRNRDDTRRLRRIDRAVLRAETTVSSTSALSTFVEIDRLLRESLDYFERVLARQSENLELPRLPFQDLSTGERSSIEELEAAKELDRALADFRAYRAEVEAREGASRMESVASWHLTISRLIEARHRALARVPERARKELLYSRAALSEVRLELRAVQLWIRGWLTVRTDEVTHLERTLERLLALRTLWDLLAVIGIVIVALWVRRNGKRVRSWWRRQIESSRLRSLGAVRRLALLERMVDVIGPPALFVGAIHAINFALRDPQRPPELDLLLAVVLWIGYYRLLRRGFEGAIVGLARRRLKIDRKTKQKIERSTILAGRTLFFGALFRALVVRIVGAGFIFHYVELLIVAFLVMVAVVLVQRWRTDIAGAYLKVWPEGTLARLVGATQKKWYGFFVAFTAFGYVLVRAAVAFGRDVVLEFDQIRKALAFLFRLRLERRAEEMGEWEGSIEQLPKSLRKAFTQGPLYDATLRIDRFPGLDKLLADLDLWRNNKAKGSFLLIGERGIGKTTWLHKAASEIDDFRVTHIPLTREIDDPRKLAATLAEELGIEDETPTTGRIAKELNKRERQVLLVDDLHHLFCRGVGGAALIDELMGLIERTGHRVFWLVSTSELMWRYHQAVHKRHVPFRAEVRLGAWSEEHISQLLMARAAASGVIHEFEDLVTDAQQERSQVALARTSQSYTRLIWDYADGSPVVAIHYWLRSLAPVDGSRVKVRLFKTPDLDRLGRMPEEAVFLYAAIALHGNLSAGEAARILRYPERFSNALLIRGHEEGYLARLMNAERYALSVQWYRAIIQFLRRKHVL